MQDDDSHVREQRRKTEAANAELARHERQSCAVLLLIILVDAVLFALVADFLLGRSWSPESLQDFIP
jgi:hypothetical protein